MAATPILRMVTVFSTWVAGEGRSEHVLNPFVPHTPSLLAEECTAIELLRTLLKNKPLWLSCTQQSWDAGFKQSHAFKNIRGNTAN